MTEFHRFSSFRFVKANTRNEDSSMFAGVRAIALRQGLQEQTAALKVRSVLRPARLVGERGKWRDHEAMAPYLAIAAFCGLRSAEIARLDWAEIRLEDGFIEVKASKAKTASRRLVPIPENLKLWLQDYRQVEGAVAAYANMSKQLCGVILERSR